MLHPKQATIIAFEEQYEHTTAARKQVLIRAELGLSTVEYHQQLHAIMRTREALELYPALVHRWTARQDAARARREARLLPRSA